MARLALFRTCAVAVLASLAGAAAAHADATVVNATVYDGSAGSGTSQTALSLSTLDGCPPYGGSDPVYLYPGESPVGPALGSSWALGTVITCGLEIPAASITGVQVYNPSFGFENELSGVQLEDPSQWSDPAAPDALPFISADGVEDQNTYVRPWLGGNDDNAIDEIVETGPIAIVVYEGSAPLTVTAAAQQLSSSDFQFTATVTGTAGAVNASDLTYDWNFGDGTADSSLLAPTHTFAPGLYPVTLQVSDTADGLGGTDTIDVQVGSSSAGSTTTTTPGPTTTTPGPTPTGPVKTSGNAPGAHRGTHTSSRPTARHHHRKAAATTTTSSPTTTTSSPTTTTTSATTPATTSSPTASAPVTAPTPTTSAPPTQASGPVVTHRHVAAKRRVRRTVHSRPVKRRPERHATGQLVTGRLLSGVIALPAGESSLVQTVQGSAARLAAGGGTAAGIAGGGIAVLLLFGLGAGQELRWRHGWRRARLRS
jgi:hypothetical protein